MRRALDPPSKLVNKLAIKNSDSVVDFGCGTGFFTLELAKRARSVIAVDISDKMLEAAREKTIEKRRDASFTVEFLRSDGRSLDLPDESVDLVFLAYVFREVNYKGEVLREFKRIIKPHGRLIIVERTRLGLNIFGLPLVRASEIIEYISDADFKHVRSIQYGTSTIVVGRKGE